MPFEKSTVQAFSKIENYNSSAILFQEAKQCMSGGVNSPVRAFKSVDMEPFFIKEGKGPFLYTEDNRQLIDCVCSMGPSIHGHKHPYLQAAIQTALELGTGFWMPHKSEISLAKAIIKWVPCAEKVRFCNSGTEAAMSALRLARGYTGRNKIIKFTGAYHGHVDSLLVKAGSGASCLGCPDSAGVPPSYTQDTLLISFNNLDTLEHTFEAYAEEVAAVIIEPYMANCGLILPLPGFLKKLRDLCTKHGALLIFDEVITGFRISLGGVQEKENIMPDLCILGKIMGGGLPAGAICGKSEIMDYFAPLGPVYQAGTMSGNPLVMAAGLASLDLLAQTNPYPALEANTLVLKKAILEAAKIKGIPIQVPMAGSIFSIFFSEHPINSYEEAVRFNQTQFFKPLFKNCLQAGLFIAPSAYEVSFLSTEHKSKVTEKTAEILYKSILNIDISYGQN